MVTLPPQYNAMTLAEFLKHTLRAYPDVKNALLAMSDESTPEYAGWHILSLKQHVCSMQVTQRTHMYQLSRVSNIRGTTGRERYVLDSIHENPLQEDEVSVAYRFFYEKFDEWVTLPL